VLALGIDSFAEWLLKCAKQRLMVRDDGTVRATKEVVAAKSDCPLDGEALNLN